MAGDEPTPKKRRFVFTPIQKPERQAKVPRFDELVFQELLIARMFAAQALTDRSVIDEARPHQ